MRAPSGEEAAFSTLSSCPRRTRFAAQPGAGGQANSPQLRALAAEDPDFPRRPHRRRNQSPRTHRHPRRLNTPTGNGSQSRASPAGTNSRPSRRSESTTSRATARSSPDSADRSFTASQTLAVQHVGFSWRAHMRIAGPIAVHVTEGLDRGEGYLDVRLLGLVRLAHIMGGDLDALSCGTGVESRRNPLQPRSRMASTESRMPAGGCRQGQASRRSSPAP